MIEPEGGFKTEMPGEEVEFYEDEEEMPLKGGKNRKKATGKTKSGTWSNGRWKQDREFRIAMQRANRDKKYAEDTGHPMKNSENPAIFNCIRYERAILFAASTVCLIVITK